jgi:branched-chain amino acid transport system permease protein
VSVFNWHVPFLLALILGIVVTVLIGVLFERLILRRMLGRPTFSLLMVTIGLDTILLTLVFVIWGSQPIPAATPFGTSSGFNIGGVHFATNDLWTIAITVVLCVLLFLFLRYTRYGLAMRATALDQESALAVGIDIRRVYALAWGLASGIATLGGVFLAISSFTITPTLGGAALLAFPAIILGGMDSIGGSIVGGIIIGIAFVLTAGYESSLTNVLGAGFHEIMPYLLMILVLLLRPYGLFGSRKVERI